MAGASAVDLVVELAAERGFAVSAGFGASGSTGGGLVCAVAEPEAKGSANTKNAAMKPAIQIGCIGWAEGESLVLRRPLERVETDMLMTK